MRQCEIKKKYDSETDLHIGKHIYGEGIKDIFKSVGKKLFGKTLKTAAKSVAKTAAKTAGTKAATITGEYAGKKAGDKIVELLSRQKKKIPSTTTSSSIPSIVNRAPIVEELGAQEINDRVNQILSGGKLRRRNFI